MKYLFLFMTVCIAVSLNYGLVKFRGRNRVLYMQMVIAGIGCALAGRLFETLMLFITGELPPGFQIGILGAMGSVFFFFTANYGQMDLLVDDRSSRFKKYRLMACAAPAAVAVLYLVYIQFADETDGIFIRSLETAAIGAASYLNLKHLIIEDVEYGIVRSIRIYNLMALIYEMLLMLEITVRVLPVPESVLAFIYILIGIDMLIFTPVLEKGIRKWTV